jgi:hypothetical protein
VIALDPGAIIMIQEVGFLIWEASSFQLVSELYLTVARVIEMVDRFRTF